MGRGRAANKYIICHMLVTAMKKNKAEEKDGGRKFLFTYIEQKVLSKETVKPET